MKTNLEAASEIARQLKLRDLAGLIVIDFIDMEERKNNIAVEKKIKDCVAIDRARIQIGRISSFGLLEMSRQRLRPGMIESTTTPCSFCHGTGITRSDESLSLQILRDLEKEGAASKNKDNILVKAPVQTTNFLINKKREHLLIIESRYQIKIELNADVSLISPHYSIEKALDEKRGKKNSDITKPRSKKRDKENSKVTSENLQDHRAPANPLSGSSGEDAEEQKKKKRKRKRRYQKDIETPSHATKKPNEVNKSELSKKKGLDPSKENKKVTSSTIITELSQKEIIATKSTLKKEKVTKPRTKASAKKTIEGLGNHDDKLTENDDNGKDPKMG